MAKVQNTLRPPLRSRAAGFARGALFFLARYALVAFLAGSLLWAVAVPTVRGERPRPKVPPDGFVFEDSTPFLLWERGDAKEPTALEVSRDDPTFAHPVHTAKTRAGSQALPPLERGRTYYWRLEPGGVVGRFKISRHALNF